MEEVEEMLTFSCLSACLEGGGTTLRVDRSRRFWKRLS